MFQSEIMNSGSSGSEILQLWKGSSYMLEIVEQNKTLGDVVRTIIIDLDIDEILYLDNGTILERGSHKELIKLNGKYANLYKMQINPEMKVK